jgi:F0F1-type ATP synthase epsilon subunit
MANRMPLMSSVKTSIFTIKTDNNSDEIIGVIGNGIVKTEKDTVVIIADDVLMMKDASTAEMEKRIKEVKDNLNQIKEDGIRKEKVQDQLIF